MQIIAEASCNHLGRIDRAIALIRAAKDAGADAVKFQCWHPERMVVARDYVLDSGPWKGRNLRDLYAEAFTPWEWFPYLFAYGKEIGIECFASVFDVEALAFLESLGCPRYKIASFEITDLPLIEAAARTGKPIVISTGMATEQEIENALTAVLHAGHVEDNKATILKCTSSYPAPLAACNLATLAHMARGWAFPFFAGVSDHTLGNTVPIVAAALGATMLEKHLTLSRADGGPDAGFSTEPTEFKAMVDACREAEAALGTVQYGPTEAERASLQFRRSLWWAKDIKAGETITAEHLVSARPALGVSPGMATQIIGAKCWDDCYRGMPVTFTSLD